MIVPLVLLALAQRPTPPAGDTTAGRPCVVDIDSVGGRAQQVEVRKGETNVFAGGGVRRHCWGRGGSLGARGVLPVRDTSGSPSPPQDAAALGRLGRVS